MLEENHLIYNPTKPCPSKEMWYLRGKERLEPTTTGLWSPMLYRRNYVARLEQPVGSNPTEVRDFFLTTCGAHFLARAVLSRKFRGFLPALKFILQSYFFVSLCCVASDFMFPWFS